MPLHASRWSARAQKSSLSLLPSLVQTDRSFLPSFSLSLTRSFSCSFSSFHAFSLSLFVIFICSILCRITTMSLPLCSSITPQWLPTLSICASQIRIHPPSSYFFFFSRFLVLPATIVIIPFLVADVTNLHALWSYLAAVHSLCLLPTDHVHI